MTRPHQIRHRREVGRPLKARGPCHRTYAVPHFIIATQVVLRDELVYKTGSEFPFPALGLVNKDKSSANIVQEPLIVESSDSLNSMALLNHGTLSKHDDKVGGRHTGYGNKARILSFGECLLPHQLVVANLPDDGSIDHFAIWCVGGPVDRGKYDALQGLLAKLSVALHLFQPSFHGGSELT